MSQKFIEEYMDFVDKVTSEASKSSDKMNERVEYLNSNGVEVSRLLTASIGLSGEVGELNEIIKKILFQAKRYDSATHEHMKRELGDILWYLTQACLALNIDLLHVIKSNKEKLSQRFPRKHFRQNNDINRKSGDF